MTARTAAFRAACLLAAMFLLCAAAGCGRKARPEPKWGTAPAGPGIHYA